MSKRQLGKACAGVNASLTYSPLLLLCSQSPYLLGFTLLPPLISSRPHSRRHCQHSQVTVSGFTIIRSSSPPTNSISVLRRVRLAPAPQTLATERQHFTPTWLNVAHRLFRTTRQNGHAIPVADTVSKQRTAAAGHRPESTLRPTP